MSLALLLVDLQIAKSHRRKSGCISGQRRGWSRKLVGARDKAWEGLGSFHRGGG